MEERVQRLVRVSTNKQFVEELENMIIPPKDYEDLSERGRMRDLKTFMLESNDGFPIQASLGRMSYEVVGTGLDGIKIMQVKDGGLTHEFYLDMRDERFFRLHTICTSDVAHRIIKALTDDRNHTLDNTWFHHNMLKRLISKPGNHFQGFGISYSDKFAKERDGRVDLANLSLDMSGSMASDIDKLLRQDARINRAGAYSKVSIFRSNGTDPSDFVQDDVRYDGYFSIKQGKSVQDHIHVLDYCKDEYAKTIQGVENERIGASDDGGGRFLDGRSFYFEFPHRIEDLDAFIDGVFNSSRPFQLWGMKQIISDGYYKILAVDLHTGSPMDFEISDDMMRAYIFKGSCGNTILRLLTNLQIHFDSQITCPLVEGIAC